MYITGIRNATNINIKEAPFVVSVGVKGLENCAGVILGPSWVVTSCFCVPALLCKKTEVRAGSSFKYEGGTVHKVKDCFPHPRRRDSFAEFPKHDMCLLMLTVPIQLDTTKSAISLYTRAPKPGTIALLAGFGPEESSTLQAASVPVHDIDDCDDMYSAIEKHRHVSSRIGEGQFCAGDVKFVDGFKRNACDRNDDGSALVIEDKLAGIVTYAEACNDKRDPPALFLSINFYYQWINQYISPEN